MKLRVKIPIIYTLLISSLVAVFILFTSLLVEERIVEEGKEYFRNFTETSALNSANAIILKDYASIKDFVDNAVKGAHISYAIILDEKGQVLSHSMHEMEGMVLEDPVSIMANKSSDILMQPVGSDIMDVTAPLMIAGKKWGAVRIGFSLTEMQSKVANTREILIVAGLAAIIFGVAVSILIARKITGPLHELQKGTEIIGRGNLDHSVQISTGDEIEQLAKAFNGMTVNLRYEVRALNAINKIIATASSYLSLSDILEHSLKAVVNSLEAIEEIRGGKTRVTGGIFLLSEKTEELLIAATYGISPEELGCQGKVALGECICGLTALAGEVSSTPFCLSDPKHTRKLPSPQKEDHEHINIPLKSGDKVLGLIFLYFSPPGYQPQPSDMEIFTSIGNYLGLHMARAQLYERVMALSIHDGLTGLYNHSEFQRLLKFEVNRAKRYAKEFSLIMMDIDYFKRFNDTYGHPAGDMVLKEAGEILKKNLRNVDIAARYGGEEFAVVFTETPLRQAEGVAERLRLVVKEHPFSVEDRSASITISIGLASFPDDADTEEGLVKAADKALYCAKESGRDRVCLFTKNETNPEQLRGGEN